MIETQAMVVIAVMTVVSNQIQRRGLDRRLQHRRQRQRQYPSHPPSRLESTLIHCNTNPQTAIGKLEKM